MAESVTLKGAVENPLQAEIGSLLRAGEFNEAEKLLSPQRAQEVIEYGAMSDGRTRAGKTKSTHA